MEGVLEKAVENAARVLNVQLRPMMPEMFLLGSTAARARGFRLEGYGVFFDVEVPEVRQSLAWSLQVIGPPDEALKSLREHVQTITNVQGARAARIGRCVRSKSSSRRGRRGPPPGRLPPRRRRRRRPSIRTRPTPTR